MIEQLHKRLRGQGTLYYGGHYFSRSSRKDPQGKIAVARARAKYGRDSLIRQVMDEHDLKTIASAMSRTSRSKNPQDFLDMIQPRLQVEKDQSSFFEFFDGHYGKDLHEVLRYLLLIHHRAIRAKARTGKEPLTTWKGNATTLTSQQFQMDFYSGLFESCPDPLGLRYALSPQWWKEYEAKDVEGMYKGILYHYRRCKDSTRSRIAEVPWVYEKDMPIYVKAAVRFTKRMAHDGIWIHPKTDFFLADTLYLDAFYNSVIQKHLKLFPWECYKDALMRMTLANPWEFLRAVSIQALDVQHEVDGKIIPRWSAMYLLKQYDFIKNGKEFQNRFGIRRIIGKVKDGKKETS